MTSCTLLCARCETKPNRRANWRSFKSCTPQALSAAARRGTIRRCMTFCDMGFFGRGFAARHTRTRRALLGPWKYPEFSGFASHLARLAALLALRHSVDPQKRWRFPFRWSGTNQRWHLLQQTCLFRFFKCSEWMPDVSIGNQNPGWFFLTIIRIDLPRLVPTRCSLLRFLLVSNPAS